MTEENQFSELTAMVQAFNGKYGLPTRSHPTTDVPIEEKRRLLEKLDEEVGELRNAIQSSELVDIADGLADAVYVLAGMAAQYGMDLDVLLRVVHASNMTKELRDGVLAKGRAYRKPAIAAALRRMRDEA